MDLKFDFDTDFQLETLRFILQNSEGFEGLKYIKSSYYDLLEHSIIAEGIFRCVKSYNRVPTKPILRNEFNSMFQEKVYYEALDDSDKENLLKITESLFQSPSRDGDIIIKNLAEFASYVELRSTIEKADLFDFNSYPSIATQVMKAIDLRDPRLEKEAGTFLIKGIKDRQFNRAIQDLVIPTPYHQLNRLTSAGGYEPGSIIVLLDRPKKMKTTFLVNTARKYLAAKRRILYIDLENGEEGIVTRLEQSVGRVTKKEIIKNAKDKEIQKVLRRYRRLGGEIYVRRLPAFSTTRDIQAVIDRVYRTEGMTFDMLIIDYLALMGALSGRVDDYGRISDAYVDVANLMIKNGFLHCWTANHIVRAAYKRQSTKYNGEDIAKCIDIVRHAQAIFGLNRTDVESAHGIMRLEIVEQREGVPVGRAYFQVDSETQRVDELTKKEVDDLIAASVLYTPESFEDPEPLPKTRGDI